MSKHVLVMCQRKNATITKKDGTVLNLDINPTINTYVTPILGDDTTIEYISKGMIPDNNDLHYQDTIDYRIMLSKLPSDSTDNKTETDNFISQHQNYYSLVILNTCPAVYMDYQSIYEILEPNGILTFTLFGMNPISERIISNDLGEMISSIVPKKLFTQTPNPEFDVNNKYVYRKISEGGKHIKIYLSLIHI